MILFTVPDLFENEHLMLNSLFAEGLKTLHLRKLDATIDEVRALLNRINKDYHNRIMLHSYYNLLEEFTLKGINFTEKNKHLHSHYSISKCVKSWSAHSIEELQNIPSDIDYVFLSPLFESISKSGYQRTWSTEELTIFMESNTSKHFKLIALGGIDHQNLPQVFKFGFDDAAILGAVWQNRHLGEKAVLAEFKKLWETCVS